MTLLPKFAIALALLIGPAASGATADQKAALGPAASGAVPNQKAALGPNTIPGFFDATTGRFTPLAIEPSTAGQEVSGDFKVLPDFRLDPDFSKDDTIFCEVKLEFGNLVNGQFFSNHTAQADVNFGAGDPDKLITVPYSYTPNSNNARVGLSISCRGTGDSGAQHSLMIYYPVEDLPHGDVTRQLTDTF
jgi:hypothetical protein